MQMERREKCRKGLVTDDTERKPFFKGSSKVKIKEKDADLFTILM